MKTTLLKIWNFIKEKSVAFYHNHETQVKLVLLIFLSFLAGFIVASL